MGTYTEQLEQIAGLSEDKLAQSELDSLEITDASRTLDQMAIRLRTIASDPGIRGEAGDPAWTALSVCPASWILGNVIPLSSG